MSACNVYDPRAGQWLSELPGEVSHAIWTPHRTLALSLEKEEFAALIDDGWVFLEGCQLIEVGAEVRPALLPVYGNGDNEQPTVCPMCGSRTVEFPVSFQAVGMQHHKCLNIMCRYEFLLDLKD